MIFQKNEVIDTDAYFYLFYFLKKSVSHLSATLFSL